MIPFFLRYEYKSLEQYSPPLSKRRILMEVFNCANHLIECLETRGNITFILRSSPVISAPEMLMEKPSMSSSLEASLVSSTAASSVSEGFGVHSGAAVLGDQPTIPALVRSALGGVPPLSPSSEVYSKLLGMGADQYVLPEMAPSLAPVGMGPIPGNCSSGVDALGERLRYSLPVMSELGVPIYLSESKSVLKYSRKNEIGKLDKHLLAETLETFSVPKDPFGPLRGAATKPLSAPAKDWIVSTLAQDKGCQPLLRGVALPPLEVGEFMLSLAQSVLGCPPLLTVSEVNLRGEVVLKSLVVLSGQRLILASVFKLWGSPMREM
jgi:hypothetical protein